MRSSVISRLGALAALACLAAVPATPSQALTEGFPPWLRCAEQSQSNELVLKYSLSPASGAMVLAGSPVTFSGVSVAPVTFEVASSPGQLSTPDIDGGPGSVTGTSAPNTPIYSLTSTKAATTPGTVYWAASFLNTGIPGCEGVSPVLYRTPAASLTVLAPPTPGLPVPGPPAAAPTMTSTAPSASKAIKIRAIYFWVFAAVLQQPQMRPSRVTFAADGNHYVTRLRWRGWGNATTRATGIDHINNCVPNCAAGHIYVVPAEVTLSRPRKRRRREVYRCFDVFAPSGPPGQRDFHSC